MIPDKDYYADKDGKLTDDPEKYERQIGVKGCFLPDHIAQRFGIGDMLVSTDEPNAPRRTKASMHIVRAEDKEAGEATTETPAAEPEAEEPKPAAPAKKEADKGRGKKK